MRYLIALMCASLCADADAYSSMLNDRLRIFAPGVHAKSHSLVRMKLIFRRFGYMNSRSIFGESYKSGVAEIVDALINYDLLLNQDHEFRDFMYQKAISMSASVDADDMSISVIALDKDIEEFTSKLSNFLSKVKVNDDAISHAIARLHNVCEARKRNAAYVARSVFRKNVLGEDEYECSLDRLKYVKPQDVQSFMHLLSNMRASNGAVFLYGDVKHDAMRSMTRSYLGKIKKMHDYENVRNFAYDAHSASDQGELSDISVRYIPGSAESTIVFGAKMPYEFTHDSSGRIIPENIVAVKLISEALGGRSMFLHSVLSTEIREKRGLAYRLSVFPVIEKKCVYMIGSLGVKNGDELKAIKVIKGVFSDIRSHDSDMHRLFLKAIHSALNKYGDIEDLMHYSSEYQFANMYLDIDLRHEFRESHEHLSDVLKTLVLEYRERQDIDRDITEAYEKIFSVLDVSFAVSGSVTLDDIKKQNT